MSKQKPNGYWNDYDRCYNEAKKYSTITEFAEGSSGAHYRASVNGWIKDYTWFIDGVERANANRVKWNYDTCYELAKQCTKKSEMKRRSSRAFYIAFHNGWIKDYTWFMSDYDIRHQKKPSRVKWSFERCYNLASECKTLSEFEKKHHVAAVVSRKNEWINFFDWLKRSNKRFSMTPDNVYVYIFEDLHAVYVGRTVNTEARDKEHRTSDKSSVFRFAFENKVDVPCMTILESGLTIKEGLVKEDYYRAKYEREGWNVLNVAKTGLLSGSIGGLGNRKWNKKTCSTEAKKYNTLKDFRKKSPAAYNVAIRNRWVSDYVWLKRLDRYSKMIEPTQ